MAMTANKTIRRTLLGAAVLLAAAAMVRTLFVGLEIDEPYALALGFRLVSGDRMFAEMWEPHQLSALPSAALMALYMGVTGTTTGVLLFFRAVVLACKAAMSWVFYREFRRDLGPTGAGLAALALFLYIPKWFLGPDYTGQQFHFTVAAFLCLHHYVTRGFRRPWLVVLGAFMGSRPGVRSRPMPWLGRFQTAALLLLIFTLGAELGANEEIVSSLGTIGLNAFVITITSMIGSMLAVHALRKYILKMDAFGRTAQEAQAEEAQASHEKAHVDHSLTVLIVAAVVLGMLGGYFVLPDSVTAHCVTVINFGLYLLLLLVGVDMGRQGTMLQDVKAAGFRVLLVPLAVMVGTFAMTALAGIFLPLGPKDCVAASAGFGW